MKSDLEQDLRPILEAISIASPALFQFRGEAVPVQPATTATMPGFPQHPLPAMPLVRDLQAVLYARCYSHSFAEGAPPAAAPTSYDPAFVQNLSRSNQSVARWENGWTIYSVANNGQVFVMKGDRQRSAMPGEFIASGSPGSLPQPGTTVSVQVVRESVAAQPGFYFVYGEMLSDIWDEHDLVRFYFHAPCEGAPSLVEYLSQALNRYQVPFRLKALNDPSLYGRTDAVVLYLARRYHAVTVRIVRQMPVSVAGELRPAIPLFTQFIRPGVGMAEEPNTGESFGMNRCRLVAEGIVDAWQRGDQTTEGRLRAIAARFQQNGFDLKQPHLSPASAEFANVSEKVEFAHA